MRNIYHQYLLTFFSKDIRLPTQLQRAMAAEAEASREARAKVCATIISFVPKLVVHDGIEWQ